MSQGGSPEYLHGFSQEEQERLRRQAEFMEFVLYQDVNFSNASHLLEVGCGVGAQTQILLRRFPNLKVKCIDLNEKQIEVARRTLAETKYADGRYSIERMNAEKMTFSDDAFDSAFLCWVLEHVPNPARVLSEVRRVLKPGSRVVITEVTNFSFFLDPYCPDIWKFWMALNDHQFDSGGDPFIGVKLGSLLRDTGYSDVRTTLKSISADKREPELRDKLIPYWEELMLSAADKLIEANRITPELLAGVIKEFKAIRTNPNAIIFDSYMQATARVP